MKTVFVTVGFERLCKLFGKTRHAYYDKNWYLEQRYNDEKIVLELLSRLDVRSQYCQQELFIG